MKKLISLVIIFAALSFSLAFSLTNTYTVTTCSDEGTGSLRDALRYAATNESTEIQFNISIATSNPPYSSSESTSGLVTREAGAGAGADRWFRIMVLSQLPTITSNEVYIHGSTQPTGEAATLANNTRGPEIEIRGKEGSGGWVNFNGIRVSGNNCTIEGLSMSSFFGELLTNSAISCEGDYLNLKGSFIGISATGEGFTNALNDYGIYLLSSNNCMIGGAPTAERNIISNNNYGGIMLALQCNNNIIRNDYIGVNRLGTGSFGNGGKGILLSGGLYDHAHGTTIESCVISNSGSHGISGTYAENSHIISNYIGTDASGEADLGNYSSGIYFSTWSTHNVIGGLSAEQGNVISGNSSYGIAFNFLCGNNSVLGNYIGTNSTGEVGISNLASGIYIYESSANTIEGNVISSNESYGIQIEGGYGSHHILGNKIGINAIGSRSLSNKEHGIDINGSYYNIIGGAQTSQRNTISGNTSYNGINIYGSGAYGNRIVNNYIGTNASGETAINNYNGIQISSNSHNNTIESNVISGNSLYGIVLDSAASNEILGNYIGITASREGALPNNVGIYAIGASSHNKIGNGTTAGRNVISGNSGAGIWFNETGGGNGVSSNEILGNYIGTTTNGAQALPNQSNGILFQYNASKNTIGGSAEGARNVISGNLYNGIFLDANTHDNFVYGNYVGTTASSDAALPNGYSGIRVEGIYPQSTSFNVNNRIKYNVISGNLVCGISVEGNFGSVIAYNHIGTNSNETLAVPNRANGISFIGADSFSCENNILGPSNVIANNGTTINDHGVFMSGTYVNQNIVTQNSIYDNYGIGISLESGANGSVATPTVASAEYSDATGLTKITGTFAANATIEAFISKNGDGKTYKGKGISSNTTIAPTVTGLSSGDVITITQTTSLGNSSGFSNTIEVRTTIYKQFNVSLGVATVDSSAAYASSASLHVATNETAVFYFKTQNTGNTNDSIKVTGEANSTSIEVKYYSSKTGTTEITGQITQEGYLTSLGSAESAERRVEIRYTGKNNASREVDIVAVSTNDASTVKLATVTAYFVPAMSKFTVTTPATATANSSFEVVINARDLDGLTQEVVGTTLVSADSGTVTPSSIAYTSFTHGVWSGRITLEKAGARTITVRNGNATGEAAIVVYNASATYETSKVPGLKIRIPVSAASGEINITASISGYSPGDAPRGFVIGSQVIELSAGSISTFLEPVEVTIYINSGSVNPKVYYWTGTAWSDNGINIISYDDSSITFTTTHFTKFAAFSLAGTYRYRFGPNPFNPITQTGHFWYWLDAANDTNIYVFDVAGNVLYNKKYLSNTMGAQAGENNVLWDGKADYGDYLGNGLYLFKVIQSGKILGGGRIAIVK